VAALQTCHAQVECYNRSGSDTSRDCLGWITEGRKGDILLFQCDMEGRPKSKMSPFLRRSWAWPAFTFTYMTVLAYVGALVTFQVGKLIVG